MFQINFFPKAPIVLTRSSGYIKGFGYGLTNNSIALVDALNAAVPGDTVWNFGGDCNDISGINLARNGVTLYNNYRFDSTTVLFDVAAGEAFRVVGYGKYSSTPLSPGGDGVGKTGAGGSLDLQGKSFFYGDTTGYAFTNDATGYMDIQGSIDVFGGCAHINNNRVVVHDSEKITIPVFPPGTNVATGDGKAYYYIALPSTNTSSLIRVIANVITAGTTGTTDIQLARVRAGTPADLLSTKLTIDSIETSTLTAATPAVINQTNNHFQDGDLIRVDVDAVSSTPPQGLSITLEYMKGFSI